MKKNKIWPILILALLLMMIPFLVPSAMMDAQAATEPCTYEPADLPAYIPVELENPDPLPLGNEAPIRPHADAFLPDDGGYLDPTISVRVESRTFGKINVQFTYIQIADATQLRTASYKPYPSKAKTKATVIARNAHAVVAMNADWFLARENNEGVVYRNGELLRSRDCGKFDALIIDTAGDFHIIRNAKVADYAPWEGQILHSFVFGPALVVDGEVVHLDRNNKTDDWIIRHNEGWHGAQRSVLCQMGPLSYLIITTEGPEQAGIKGYGLSIEQVAQLAADLGAQQAYNMDGGSSTWLVLGEDRINTKNTKNFRQISDIVYFATAEP